jgi:predicted  nucleic acid-binding Zn-ribbon protein
MTIPDAILGGALAMAMAIIGLIFRVGKFAAETRDGIDRLQDDLKTHRKQLDARIEALETSLEDIRGTYRETVELKVQVRGLKEEVVLVRQRTHDFAQQLVVVMGLSEEFKEMKKSTDELRRIIMERR